MNSSFFNSPSPIDLLGLPEGEYFTHSFPPDMAAAEIVQVTLNNVKKRLINFTGEKVVSDKNPKRTDRMVRHTEIELRFPQKIKAVKLFLNMDSRIVFIFGTRDTVIFMRPEILKPSEAHIVTYYEKKHKRKIINACFLGAGHPVADIHLAMSRCEVVMAVDTNYIDVSGIGRVSATTAIEVRIKKVTENAYHVQSGPMRQKITINPPGNPEIFGIGTMMFHFLDDNPNLRERRLGIVTDTELDLLKDMSHRTVPFFNSMLLPENTDLFYATSDTGSAEFAVNKLMRVCDNSSTEYLNKYLVENVQHTNSRIDDL